MRRGSKSPRRVCGLWLHPQEVAEDLREAHADAAHAQSAAVASSPSAQEDQDLIEAVSAPWDSWEE